MKNNDDDKYITIEPQSLLEGDIVKIKEDSYEYRLKHYNHQTNFL